MLMTHLHPSPIWVASVRTAITLPIFTLALLAGALADRLDRRRLLLFTQIYLFCITTIMCALTAAQMMTPPVLLICSFCIGIGMCFHVPVWQSVIPEIVSRRQIPAAVGLGSLSFNLARCLGPAVCGIVIGLIGFPIAFGLNAISFVAVIMVLLNWKRTKLTHEHAAPTTGVVRSTIEGLKFVLGERQLRNVYARLMLFLIPASVVWSLIYLIARDQYGLLTLGQGLLISMFGLGAVCGTVVLPAIRRRLGSNSVVMILSVFYGLAALWIGLGRNYFGAGASMFAMGASWMGILTTLNATAQLNLPDQYRARGMSMYLTVMSLGISAGALIWGVVARYFGTSSAFIAAGAITPILYLTTYRVDLSKLEDFLQT
jgi:predicted MFS family arabinose efflux permease